MVASSRGHCQARAHGLSRSLCCVWAHGYRVPRIRSMQINTARLSNPQLGVHTNTHNPRSSHGRSRFRFDARKCKLTVKTYGQYEGARRTMVYPPVSRWNEELKRGCSQNSAQKISQNVTQSHSRTTPSFHVLSRSFGYAACHTSHTGLLRCIRVRGWCRRPR